MDGYCSKVKLFMYTLKRHVGLQLYTFITVALYENGQPHAPTTLFPRQERTLPFEQETGWSPKPVRGFGEIKFPARTEHLSNFILINYLASESLTHRGLSMCNPALFLYFSWIKAVDSLPPLVNCGTFTHLASFRGRAISTACQATTYARQKTKMYKA